MNKKSRVTLFILIVITVVLVVLIAFSGSPNSDFTFVYRIFGTPVTLVQKGFSFVGEKVSSFFTFVSSSDEIMQKLDELTEENDELKLLESENEQLKAENEELKNLLSVKNYSADYDFVSANIIATDISDWFNYYTIDVGTTSGITKNSVVISSAGIVGIVEEAGLTTSKIVTIVDEQNVFMCRVARTNRLVRVRGVSADTHEYMLKIDMISGDTEIQAGDILYTASSGDIYPEGLAVGVITELVTGDTSGSVEAYVKPNVDFTTITHVYVLKEKTTENASEAEK